MAANIDRVRLEAIEKRRGEAEELVKSRKRKLAELYTVSTLSRIRTTTDEHALKNVKDSLLSFLEKNDIQRGRVFEPSTLPPLEYDFDDTLLAPSSSDQSQLDSQKTNSRPSRALNQGESLLDGLNSEAAQPPSTKDDTRTQPTVEQPQQTQSASSQHPQGLPIIPSQPQSVPVQSKQSQPSQSSPLKTEPHQQSNTTVPQISVLPAPSQISSTDSSSAPGSSGKLLSLPQSQVSSKSQTQSPIPLGNYQQLPLELYKKKAKLRKAEDRQQLFDPENKDAIDTLAVLLKSHLPPKIAEITPLSELYYLAQTLPLVKLMPSTHKAVTSTMFETALTEGKINVIHNRIEELKRQSKWSLKQPSKFIDPYRTTQKTHWDNLLSEMNWMAVDFKEGRKLKIAACDFIAQSIEEYWTYGKVCCVKRRPIKYIEPDVEIPATSDVSEEETPAIESEPATQQETADSIDISKLLQRPDPSTEFVLPTLPQTTTEELKKLKEQEDISPFKLFIDTNDLKLEDKTLLDSMPSFTSFQYFNDQQQKAPLIPVSKSLVRDDDETWFNLYLKQVENEEDLVPVQQKGLFGFSSQRRLTASIKPPPPPSLKYLNLRTPTIWLPEDDQDLIEYVNLFSFNWGVVSAHLTKRPTRNYQSNIERRTPWQCFERYIQLNDTFQINDMRGQNYMSSMKWLEHAHHIQATTKRRISPLGVGPDSIQRGHKRLRWASMFEGIRKCMRKRENVTRPNPNQTRKISDEKKVVAQTPAELSKLKFEREKAIQEAYMQNTATNQTRARAPVGGSTAPIAATAAGSGSAPGSRSAQASRTGPQPTPVPVVQTQQKIGVAQRPNSVPAQGVPKGGNPIVVAVPQGALPQLRGANGQQYTQEQLQLLLRKQQQQQQQQQQSQSGSVQGTPSPSNGNVQLVPQMRSNSNPVSGIQGAGSPMPLSQGVNGLKPSSAGAATVSTSNNANVARKNGLAQEQIQNVIQQIHQQHPNMSKPEVTKIAIQYLGNLSRNRVNSGGNGVIANDVKPKSNVNSPMPSQSPVVQPKPAPVAVPTPQQILQQQTAMSTVVPAGSTPQRVVGTVPMAGQSNVAIPGVASPIQQLTPQQKAQLSALQGDAQRRQQNGSGGMNGVNKSSS